MRLVFFFNYPQLINTSLRYDSRVPPILIGVWFDKAPMLFLAIAAVSFVIGLNLFAYFSLQVCLLSFLSRYRF